MGLISGLWLVVLGVLGASNLIIASRPNARELIGKLAPYQGWIGALSALWGVWGILYVVLHLGVYSHFPILMLTMLASGAVQVALGLLLGVGVLKSFIKNPQAQAKMDHTIARLAPKQGMLGLVAIGLGIWTVIAGLVIWSF